MTWWTSRPLMRGVNLGGWLLLERWMQESLFRDTPAAWDEYSLCTALGDAAPARLQRHRESYITRADFAWIAARGLNAVRIPFGYWLLEPESPYVAGIDLLDQALQWCTDFGLMAVLDLHGAPGGQSREHHTGRSNHYWWPHDERHRLRTLHVLEALAQRYGGWACVRGISLLNEPAPDIAAGMLNDFYREAYRRIRRYMPYERVAMIIPAFTEQRLHEFHGVLAPHEYENVITDLHLYQCFGEWFSHLSLEAQLSFPITHRLPQLRSARERGWVMVGEWSLRLPWQPHDIVRERKPHQQDAAWRTFGEQQLHAYEQTQGWFFWSYKAENQPEWSLRECVERHWLPDRFDN